MKSLALAELAVAARGAAGPWTVASTAQGTFGGRAPGEESEPNDRPCTANPLGAVPWHAPLAVWGELAHPLDVDFYRIDVLAPSVLEVRVVTGSVLMPFSAPGSSGFARPTYTDSFLPVLAIYGPEGRLVYVHASEAPNLLLKDLHVPLAGASFFLALTPWPGSYGAYGLQVETREPAN
jgi:hypothetical protein